MRKTPMEHRQILSFLEMLWIWGAGFLVAYDWVTVEHSYLVLKVVFMGLSCCLVVKRLLSKSDKTD